MADLHEAFSSFKVEKHPKQIQSLWYIFRCIHCNSNHVSSVTDDGGSIQICRSCGQTYKAKKNLAHQYWHELSKK